MDASSQDICHWRRKWTKGKRSWIIRLARKSYLLRWLRHNISIVNGTMQGKPQPASKPALLFWPELIQEAKRCELPGSEQHDFPCLENNPEVQRPRHVLDVEEVKL